MTQISAEMNKELQTCENEMLCIYICITTITLIIYLTEGWKSAVRTQNRLQAVWSVVCMLSEVRGWPPNTQTGSEDHSPSYRWVKGTFLASNVTRAQCWPLTYIYHWGYECVELYFCSLSLRMAETRPTVRLVQNLIIWQQTSGSPTVDLN